MHYIRIFLWCTVVSLYSQESLIAPISSDIAKRMKAGHSWHRGCPVGLEDLRYVRVPYLGFDGKRHSGELIVHKDVATEVTHIFKQLYTAGYPIRHMRLISDYNGNDWQSIEADNTSAFNCRRATHSGTWSRHAYGKAIDINPLENPYISHSGRIAHKASLPYATRTKQNDLPYSAAVITPHGEVVRLFARYGWKWGGTWKRIKDYQHFYKQEGQKRANQRMKHKK